MLRHAQPVSLVVRPGDGRQVDRRCRRQRRQQRVRGGRPPPGRPDLRREPRAGTASPATRRSGRCLPSHYVGPVYTYPSGADVVVGGYVVRDPTLPTFAGRYLFCSAQHRNPSAWESNGTATDGLSNTAGIVGFGEDGAGRLFATGLTGPVYRLTQTGSRSATFEHRRLRSAARRVFRARATTNRLSSRRRPATCASAQGGRVSDFLDLTSLITTAGGEQGLLAFAVAPDYATSGRVFAYFTNKQNDLGAGRVPPHRREPDRSDVATRRPLLTIPHRPGRQPQRRPAPVRARQAALPVDRRRRHPGRPRGRRPEPRLPARQDHPHRRRHPARHRRHHQPAPEHAGEAPPARPAQTAARSSTCAAARPAG